MKKYDIEFKQQAVKKILDGQSVASLSRELGVAEGVLHKWKKMKLESSSSVEQEFIELKKKLREVEMERDILKKLHLSLVGMDKTIPAYCQRERQLSY